MIKRMFCAACAAALVAGCSAEDEPNQAQPGNDLMQSAETRTVEAGPLTRDQALAVMDERHESMEKLGDETKKVNNQLKSPNPDVGQIRQSAATILQLSTELHSWFPEGTGPDVGKTRAKAELWQKPDDFATKANEAQRAAEAFDSAAKSGDLGQIQASFAALGKSCKACHDPYRSPEDNH